MNNEVYILYHLVSSCIILYLCNMAVHAHLQVILCHIVSVETMPLCQSLFCCNLFCPKNLDHVAAFRSTILNVMSVHHIVQVSAIITPFLYFVAIEFAWNLNRSFSRQLHCLFDCRVLFLNYIVTCSVTCTITCLFTAKYLLVFDSHLLIGNRVQRLVVLNCSVCCVHWCTNLPRPFNAWSSILKHPSIF